MVRQQQGLSLHGVEERSDSRWKAVVVGSYERGDRAVSVQRLSELADFYGVPVAELLPEQRVSAPSRPSNRVVINLERLSALPRDMAAPLVRFVRLIQSRRGDFNGRVLTVRADDLSTIALLYGESPEAVAERFGQLGVMSTGDEPAAGLRQRSG